MESITRQLAEAARSREATAGSPGGRMEKRRKPSFDELAAAGFPGSPPVAKLPDDDLEDVLPSRRISPMTMIWIVLAITGATIRACGGGG